MLAVGANGTVIMSALPTMQTELFRSSAGVQWAVSNPQLGQGLGRNAWSSCLRYSPVIKDRNRPPL
jgi:hypothetical protein